MGIASDLIPTIRMLNCDGLDSRRKWSSMQQRRLPESLSCMSAGNLTSISALVPSGQAGAPGRRVSVWTTPDKIQNFQWALHSAVAILPRCPDERPRPHAM